MTTEYRAKTFKSGNSVAIRIPAALWADLKSQGLLDEGAPTPA